MPRREDMNPDSVKGQRLVPFKVRQIRIGDVARVNDGDGVLADDFQLAVARHQRGVLVSVILARNGRTIGRSPRWFRLNQGP